MKTTSTTTNLIACAAIIGAFTFGFATGPAFAQKAAQGDADTFKFSFSYQDHELTSAPAAEKLLIRLQKEVRAYCGGISKMTLDERAQVRDCVDTTMRQSIDKFGSTVAMAYQSRAGG